MTAARRNQINRYKTRGGQYGNGFGMTLHSTYSNNEKESCYTCVYCSNRRCTVVGDSIVNIGKSAAYSCKHYRHDGNADTLTISKKQMDSKHEKSRSQSEKENRRLHLERGMRVIVRGYGPGMIRKIISNKVFIRFERKGPDYQFDYRDLQSRLL